MPHRSGQSISGKAIAAGAACCAVLVMVLFSVISVSTLFEMGLAAATIVAVVRLTWSALD